MKSVPFVFLPYQMMFLRFFLGPEGLKRFCAENPHLLPRRGPSLNESAEVAARLERRKACRVLAGHSQDKSNKARKCYLNAHGYQSIADREVFQSLITAHSGGEELIMERGTAKTWSAEN